MRPRLRLLGSPQLGLGDEIRDLPVDKPASLLYYLAMRGDWVRRAELAYLYRPDAPEETALANVRVLLHRAKALAVDGLEVERSRVRYEVATDVGEFTRLVEQGDPAAALRLYRGQFLSGLSVPDSSGYETWLELQRADLARTWRAAVLRECAELEARGEHVAVADLVRPVVAADGLDEEAAQVLIRSLLAAGRRSEALAAYEDLRRVLAEELQAEPLDGTAALVASVSGATGRVGPSEGPNAGQRTRGNRLPVRTTRFHGRSAEMAALEELLNEPDRRLVTVTGLGGVGKSRLALEVARRRSDEHPNGVWFVELAGTAAPELLPQAIGSAMGQDLANARDAKAVLMDRLREKDTLLVLDNFEHLLDGAGLLTELLEAAPRVRLLVTSRQALGLTGETVVELVGLATPPRGDSADLGGFDAVKLFVDRAERLSTRFVAAGSTLEAIAELTRRVEGMPLALELAATWTRSVTVDELLAELAEDIGRLAADLRDLPERQRSIRTVLDYSWRSLTPEEQRSLARLTVFRGGFTLAAAEKVTGVHAALLYGLGAHSLVSRGADGRFRVHELVRQFAAERLTGAEAQAIRAAHSRHYLSEVAERLRVSGSAERAAVIRELFDELDNVRFALEHAVESFDIGLLEATLPPLFSLHLEAGALADITSVLEGLAAELEARAAEGPGRVETERAAEDEPLRLVVTQQLGRAYMAHGYFAAAVDKLEPLVPVLRDAAAGGRRNVTEALARALDWLGSCYRINGDLEAAEGAVAEALAMAEEAYAAASDQPNTGLLADVVYNLSSLRRHQGRVPESVEHLERSLALSLSAGDEVRAAWRRIALATTLLSTGGDMAVAERHLEEALATGRVTRIASLQGSALNALAVVADRKGSFVDAERLNLESYELARQLGQRDDQRVVLANLAGLLHDRGRYDEAAVYLRRALEHALATRNPAALNQAYSLLGANCSARGDHAGAAAYFRSALEPEAVKGLPPMALTQCLSLLANAHEQAGRVDRATTLRAYLLEEPATPPPVRQRIEGRLAGLPADALPRLAPRPTLPELVSLERDALRTFSSTASP